MILTEINKILVSLLLVIAGSIVVGVLSPTPSYAAPLCSNPSKGVLRDWYGGTDTYLVGYYMNTVQIKNTSINCAYKVGIASYKAYEDYRISVYSQTYYASQTQILQPGQKWTHTIAIPGCTYQTDVYWGDTIKQFTSNSTTYSGQSRFLDGWYFPGNPEQRGKLPTCTKQRQAAVKAIQVVKSTPKPTIVVTATPQPTPPPQLPSTGPGSLVTLAIIVPVAALMAKKYYQ